MSKIEPTYIVYLAPRLGTTLQALLTHLDWTNRFSILYPAGGGEAAAWAAWSGERACAASVAQIRDRLASAAPFCASLHAILTHLDLDELISPLYVTIIF